MTYSSFKQELALIEEKEGALEAKMDFSSAIKLFPICSLKYCLFSSEELQENLLPNLVCSTCMGRRQKIVNFMTHHPSWTYVLGKNNNIDVFL